MDWIDTVMSSQLTPISLCLTAIALIITSFARGWIVSRFTVETLLGVQNLRIEEAIKRGDDYKLAWELAEKRADILQKLVVELKVVGESVDKLLNSLPVPHNGDGGGVDK